MSMFVIVLETLRVFTEDIWMLQVAVFISVREVCRDHKENRSDDDFMDVKIMKIIMIQQIDPIIIENINI